MDATWTLLDLGGAVALLIWGVHMVQTGIERAFGPDLRRFLSTTLHHRLAAFAAGIGVTAILQSSTATGLMATGLAASGAVSLVPALAVMLGANVGTTLMVQVFSFNVAGVAPALVLVGVILFNRGGATRTHDLGRVAIGLGLMLMALHALVRLVAPFEDAPSFRIVLGALATQPVLDVLLAAVLTWAAHSSVSVVLLTMSLAAQGAIPPEAAFALVLGANLGTAINPVLEGVRGDDPVSRRLPIGNLLTRVLGCVVALILLDRIGPLMVMVEPDAGRAVAVFHTAFNLAIALLMLPLLGPYAALLRRILPARVNPSDPASPRYLDSAALGSPPIALAAARREALRMADALEAMLNGAAAALRDNDRRRMIDVRRLDDRLDRLNSAIKGYLTRLDPDALNDTDIRRQQEVLVFTTNLESAGDVVDHNVMGFLVRRLKQGLALPEHERQEAVRLLERLMVTLRAAAAVLLTEDARAARLLATEKEAFHTLEADATAAHFAAMRAGGAETESSALRLDLLREFKRINGYLVAAVADPVLEGHGVLLPSRVRVEE